MKKLYWWVQQINRLGGAEMVSIDLMNRLSKYYDVTLISTVTIDDNIPYFVDPKVKKMTMGLPKRTERVDVLTKKYLSYFRIISLLALYLQVGFHYFIKKGIYRKRIQKLLLKDDATLICSAVDSYMLAPKKGKVFFHFHFQSERFFASDNYPVFKISRKPTKFIFLSKTTMDEVCERRPDLKGKSTYIYNPIRFEPVLNTDYHNNTIIFVGRFAYQKNPMLALAVAKELVDRKFNFKLKMFGDPILRNEMEEYISSNHLEGYVTLNNPTNNTKEEILNSDLLLLTSRFEGVPLVANEANALSRPYISSNWGSVLNEFLIPGKNGYVAKSNDPKEFADIIIDLLSNKEKLKQIKESSYYESLRLSEDKIIPLWKELIG